MSEYPLLVFATSDSAPTLLSLREELRARGYPASFGVDITGEASDEQMNSTNWEAAFLRWSEPEIHEVALIERFLRGEDEEADSLLAEYARHTAPNTDAAGRLIISAHLKSTQEVYAIQLLPALFSDQDHSAWSALDILLRSIARQADGIIYAESEGFCDPDGEFLLTAEYDDADNPDTEQSE